jgi:hypothetical protein
MSFSSDLLRRHRTFIRLRNKRERALARTLVSLYREARNELRDRFYALAGAGETLALGRISTLMAEFESKLTRYTQLTAEARIDAIKGMARASEEATMEILLIDPAQAELRGTLAATLGMIPENLIEAVVGNIPRLAGKVTGELLERIHHQLQLGAALGESIPKIAQRIAGTGITLEGINAPFRSVYQRSTVIARTEIIKAAGIGYDKMAQEMQALIEEELLDAYVTSSDDRVSKICRALGSKGARGFVPVEGLPGVYPRKKSPNPVINSHVCCRCRKVPVLRSWIDNGLLNLDDFRVQARKAA